MSGRYDSIIFKTKLALRRDNTVPVGVSSPLHSVCTCGAKIDIYKGDRHGCLKCGVVVDSNGWMILQ
jgi:hypothetical protein